MCKVHGIIVAFIIQYFMRNYLLLVLFLLSLGLAFNIVKVPPAYLEYSLMKVDVCWHLSRNVCDPQSKPYRSAQ
jgi:hypothetical protein